MRSAFYLILLILFTSLPAQAYIPRTKSIVRKISNNNGSLQYKIVREVLLEADSKQVKAREVWTVANGDTMKVEVNSLDANNPWKFTIVYDSDSRKTLSEQGNAKEFKKSREFFEPLFHDRSQRSLMSRLVAHRFLPNWAKDTPPPGVKDGETQIAPEPFIQLEPVEGTVSYAIGASRSSVGSKGETQLWVEQDSFLIKKARLPSSAEFINSNFQSFQGGLKLPSDQLISWNNKVAKVKLLSVEKTSTNKNTWTLSKGDRGNVPSDPLIKEFYSRFR